ncbi:MAG TPA: formyltransferase family protein [Pyrinomonadaceae bacterium]|nr:formyltransferase family protein [Pyrinomonadaceae bacterium]
MRTGILVHSLPAALDIYEEAKRVPGVELFVLVCPAPGDVGFRGLAKQIARLIFKSGRAGSLKLLAGRKVILFQKPLDHPDTLARLEKLKLDVGLHKTGIIYRESTVKAFRSGILNPHIGLLPEYRGRGVMEWAIIEGKPVGVTVFFVDAGIDTGGRVVLREEIQIPHCKSIQETKQYLFNLDALLFRRALELLSSEDFRCAANDASGRRYYVMSNLFQGAVEEIMRRRTMDDRR